MKNEKQKIKELEEKVDILSGTIATMINKQMPAPSEEELDEDDLVHLSNGGSYDPTVYDDRNRPIINNALNERRLSPETQSTLATVRTINGVIADEMGRRASKAVYDVLEYATQAMVNTACAVRDETINELCVIKED